MRKTFVKKMRSDGQMSLQITSMADIFMIILVFLLKSYGTGTIDVTPQPGLVMPRASDLSGPAEGVKLEIAEGEVRVNGAAVAKIERFEFASSDLSVVGASKTLVSALETEIRERPGSQVIVLADRRAPYSTVKAALASAAVSGYSDFKLAVVNPN